MSVLLAGRVPAQWIRVTAALVSGVLILFTAMWWRRMDRGEWNPSQDLMFAAALAVTVVTPLYMYEHDLGLLLLAIFLTIGSHQWSRKTPWRTVLNISIAVLYMPPVYLFLGDRSMHCLLWFPLFAFALALFAMLRQPPAPELTASGANGVAAASPSGGLGGGMAL